jgi:hypothetical protein
MASRSSLRSGLLGVLSVLVIACGSSSGTPPPLPSLSTETAPAVAADTPAAATDTPEATPQPETVPPSAAGMVVRFVNLTDGGSVAVGADSTGHQIVKVKLEVTGGVPFAVSLTANGLPAVDPGGHQLVAENPSGATPFDAELVWIPADGGGDYTLVAQTMDVDKNFASATIRVTVTGAPHVTLPPALTEAQARAKVKSLIKEKYQVTIPRPSLQRFDAPMNPTRGRWIGAAYYKGTRYYVSIFDDGHVEWENLPYADRSHLAPDAFACRPSGAFKVLVVFVDYGNTDIVRDDALPKVPIVVNWLNGLYTNFATSHGSKSALMSVQADATWVASPPTRNALLTATQIRTLGGKDPSAYDFVMQIDLDVNGGWGVANAKGVMEPGGGFALNGCESESKLGPISIWSSVTNPAEVQGNLVMDFNHELSHLFGMEDDYPYYQGGVGPDGQPFDDWIPYVLFGWTDTDGDGIPEVIDPTPYGTAGPKP